MKIDQSFVRSLGVERTSRTIIESIRDLSENLSIGCVVEGVETLEQVEIFSVDRVLQNAGLLFRPAHASGGRTRPAVTRPAARGGGRLTPGLAEADAAQVRGGARRPPRPSLLAGMTRLQAGFNSG